MVELQALHIADNTKGKESKFLSMNFITNLNDEFIN